MEYQYKNKIIQTEKGWDAWYANVFDANEDGEFEYSVRHTESEEEVRRLAENKIDEKL